MIGGVRDRTLEAILKYGDKARIILRSAITIYDERGNQELGDFDYKTLIAELQREGYSGDPKMILRALERDFGIIETSYKSANQHWWKFIDVNEVKSVIDDNNDDPEITLIKIQANSLDLDNIQKRLEFMLRKTKLSDVDKALFKKIAFDDLNYLIDVYKKAESYEETQYIVDRIKRILILASKVSVKINGKGNNKELSEKEGERQNSNVNGLRLFDNENLREDTA
ncbi:hypothetical protein [Acidianus brierleyi]|uniref:Uncharacterized protein n=1 Tax=Acidianus brierleyi TaxID=41673 RepID=A0A2U9IBG1_9CREN|nr:hypothetical protein [Acidianus brierleyi]AWR93345.1 hypothetical protein DFR85_00715 [Acidianus brierleyi]